MTDRDRSLDYRCQICGASPKEPCESHSGDLRYESHPERIEAMHLREFFRKRVVLPPFAVGSPDLRLLPRQRMKVEQIAVEVRFPR
jgi:hypothetical protein